VKVKLDEGLSYRLKPILQELGHDVDTVVDEGLKSEADTVLAEIARQNNRMLFTLDRGLGDVRQYVPGEHPGIVVFRLSKKSNAAPTNRRGMTTACSRMSPLALGGG